MFKYNLYHKKTFYALHREDIACGCPFKGKGCGTWCPLFDIEQTPKGKKTTAILKCATPPIMYKITEILYPNGEKE